MKTGFFSVLCAVAAMLPGVCVAPAQAQGSADSVIVPDSDVAHWERGDYLHTCFLIHNPIASNGIRPMGGLGPAGGMTPTQVRSFYGIPSTGGSQVIAIIDAYDTPNALNDFNTFSKQFKLPVETSTTATAGTNKVFQVVYQNGQKPPSGVFTGWDVETALDIEWAHAMAPSAKIVLIEAQAADDNLYACVDIATKIANVKEVSMSWGGGEFTGETSYDSHFPTGKGIVYFAATGDSGAGTIYPSTSPNVVACGGTTVNTDANGKFTSEIGWSGSGGGPSTVELKPKYQVGIANTSPVWRSVPDMAALADPNTGVSVYEAWNGGWFVVGGTSVATPLLAGMTNESGYFLADTPTELALVYTYMATIFRDIVSGSNGAYSCTKGYDYVTGVGVP